MTDDEAAMKQDPEPSLAVKAAAFCILLIVAPVLMWSLLFGVVWVIYSFPWSIPHPMFLADCLATGSQWACERV